MSEKGLVNAIFEHDDEHRLYSLQKQTTHLPNEHHHTQPLSSRINQATSAINSNDLLDQTNYLS